MDSTPSTGAIHRIRPKRSLALSERASRIQRLGSFAVRALLFTVTAMSAVAVLFIVYFILRNALPFSRMRSITEFFTSTRWYPTNDQAPEFGAAAIFIGHALVTLGAAIVAVPLGVLAAICLSDLLPFSLRQMFKPVIEVLAAIPSVAYGFFALVVFAPLLRQHGGHMLAVGVWAIGVPLGGLLVFVLSDVATGRFRARVRQPARWFVGLGLAALALWGLASLSTALGRIEILTGKNALNGAIILGIMALPTVVSVSEDALQAVGRELREGSYACGATRAETLMKVVLPAARGGIFAAVILGLMRAVGETMTVWMATGNAVQVPTPWYNYTESVRTLTATIAAEMGETPHTTASAHFTALFAMALCLLAIALLFNLLSEWVVRRTRAKLRGR